MQTESGFALMAVLFIAAMVSTLALSYATTARLKALQVRHGQEKVQDAFRLSSCLELGWHEYQKYTANSGLMANKEEVEAITDATLDLWYPRFEPYHAEVDGQRYEVQLFSEAGRLDINRVSSDILLKILQLCGAAEPDALAMMDAIRDFVDRDDNHRLNGAENDYYQSLDAPYSCKNMPFENIEELLLVRGITPDIYFGSEGRPGLVDVFSVLGGASSFDINSVSPLVFGIVEEMPAEAFQAIVDFRQEKPIANINDLSEIIEFEYFSEFKTYFSVQPTDYLRITATRRLDGGRLGGYLSETHELTVEENS